MMSGPARGRRRRVRVLRALLPCLALIAFDGTSSQRPDRSRRTCSARPATASCRRRIRRCAGPRRVQRPHRRCRQRRAAARQGPAGAVADRADPDLRPSRRQRRVRIPATTRSTARARSRNSIRARPSRSRRRSRQPAAAAIAGSERTGAAVDPAVGDRQQDADPAGDGRHGGRASRRASGSRSTTIRSARSAITPAAS